MQALICIFAKSGNIEYTIDKFWSFMCQVPAVVIPSRSTTQVVSDFYKTLTSFMLMSFTFWILCLSRACSQSLLWRVWRRLFIRTSWKWWMFLLIKFCSTRLQNCQCLQVLFFSFFTWLMMNGSHPFNIQLALHVSPIKQHLLLLRLAKFKGLG